MSAANTFLVSVFFFLFYIHLVQCRDFGALNPEDLITGRNDWTSAARTVLSGNDFLSGEETDELTIEFTPITDISLTRRKKKKFLSTRIILRKFLMNGVLLFHSILESWSLAKKNLIWRIFE